MLHFNPRADTGATNSRLTGRRRVADALLRKKLAATGYLMNTGSGSLQNAEVASALARTGGRPPAPGQPVRIAFRDGPAGTGVSPRSLDYGLGRTMPVPLHSPFSTGSRGRYGEPPIYQPTGDTWPMAQLFGTGEYTHQDSRHSQTGNLRADTIPSKERKRESKTFGILPMRRDGETGALSLAVPRVEQGARLRALDQFRVMGQDAGRRNQQAAQNGMAELQAMDPSGELEQELSELDQRDQKAAREKSLWDFILRIGEDGKSRTGNMVPFHRDGETRELSLAVPNAVRGAINGAISTITMPGDVASGMYDLGLDQPGTTWDDGGNVYRNGEFVGNIIHTERAYLNRAIGSALDIASGGTASALTRGSKAAMDPSLLRMGGGGGKRAPRRTLNRNSSDPNTRSGQSGAHNPIAPSTLHQTGTRIPGGRTIDATIPGNTKVRNAKGRVFKHVDNPPSKPHAGMRQHTHLPYYDVSPDGRIWRGVDNFAVPQKRIDVIDASRPGARRTGGPK